MILRSLAAFCGVSILASTACMRIIATGGLFQPSSMIVATVAAGVALGAVVIGHAVSQGRTLLALWLALAMLSGEAFGLLSTAERYVVAREGQQAPLKKAAELHAAAIERVAAAEKSVSNSSKTSARLQIAEVTLNDADAKVRASAADRGCRENCRALLQAQVDAARKDVDEARSELSKTMELRNDELSAARADVEAHPMPASATPLADRLGVAPWALDLFMAVLGAFGANGLAAGLLAYSAHVGHHGQADVPSAEPAAEPQVTMLEPDLRSSRPTRRSSPYRAH